MWADRYIGRTIGQMMPFLKREERIAAVAKRYRNLIDDIQMEIISANWPGADPEMKKKIVAFLTMRLNDLVNQYKTFLFES